MIYPIQAALAKIEAELEAYIPDDWSGNEVVTLGNVAQIESSAGDAQQRLENHIIISLVNIEEESALKNGVHFRKNVASGSVDYENPPINLNLYLLFSAYFPANYVSALQALSLVIRFFQGKNTFRFAVEDLQGVDADEEFELSLDLYTLTFEQINHLWGSLGGKQMPFAMYKTRLVSISDRRKLGNGRLIERIDGNANVRNNGV